MGLSGVLVSLALCWASNGCDPPEIYYADTNASHQHSAWPAPTPPPQVEQWRSMVSTYFPASEVDRALCIIWYESGGDPDADNPGSTSAGLFQVLRATWDGIPTSITGGSYSSGRVYHPEANVKAAAWLQDRYGWAQWSTYNGGLCQ